MQNKEELVKEIEKVVAFLVESPKVEVAEDNGSWKVNIESDNSGMLIGRFGQTLAALQYVIRMIIQKKAGRVPVVVDVAGYKESKIKELEELALQVAENVKKSGYPQTLRPMNPFERRIIHTALNGFEGVKTTSMGEEPTRYIEIKPE